VTATTTTPEPSILDRPFPPIAGLATVALASVVVGGILMASYVPRRPPLTLPLLLLTIAAVLLVVDVVLLVRLRDFAWDRFWLVFRWALLAYVISAGMIEFAFVRNHTRGAPLVVVTLMLTIFATSVPLIIAFTVARYASPPVPSSIADSA
jgi:hypothetical protein